MATMIFWLSAALLFYIFFAFPIICALKGLLFPVSRPAASVGAGGPPPPFVSIIVAAYNEEPVIAQKITNTLNLRYPADAWEMIIASDGSTDATVAVAEGFDDKRIRVLDLPRRGKNATLNDAVKYARGSILVFTDADIQLDADALTHLVAPFVDENIGCVAGEYRHAPDRGSANKGERWYWRFDLWLKSLQARGGSATCATGALYALRACLFESIPANVTDDFFTSTRAVAAGKRIVTAPAARAYGFSELDTDREFARKIRVISRGLRSVWAARSLWNPFRYGWYAVQIITHKVLRRFAFIPLLSLFGASLCLYNTGALYRGVASVQIVFHSLALAGALSRKMRFPGKRMLQIPYYIDMVYAAVIMACIDVATGGGKSRSWNPQGRSVSTGSAAAAGN